MKTITVVFVLFIWLVNKPICGGSLPKDLMVLDTNGLFIDLTTIPDSCFYTDKSDSIKTIGATPIGYSFTMGGYMAKSKKTIEFPTWVSQKMQGENGQQRIFHIYPPKIMVDNVKNCKITVRRHWVKGHQEVDPKNEFTTEVATMRPQFKFKVTSNRPNARVYYVKITTWENNKAFSAFDVHKPAKFNDKLLALLTPIHDSYQNAPATIFVSETVYYFIVVSDGIYRVGWSEARRDKTSFNLPF